jgi:hypothetical protein
MKENPLQIAAGFVTALCIISVLPAAMSRASWLAAIGGSVFIGILYWVRNGIFIEYFKKTGFARLSAFLFEIIISCFEEKNCINNQLKSSVLLNKSMSTVKKRLLKLFYIKRK